MSKLECFWTLRHLFHLLSHCKDNILLLYSLFDADIFDLIFFLTLWLFRQSRLLAGSDFDLSAWRIFLCFFFLFNNLFNYLSLNLININFLFFIFNLFLHFFYLVTNLLSRLLPLFQLQILLTAKVYTKFWRHNLILTQKMFLFVCYLIWRTHQLWKIMQFIHIFINFKLLLTIIFGKMKFMHWRPITLRINILEKTRDFFVFFFNQRGESSGWISQWTWGRYFFRVLRLRWILIWKKS